MTVPQRTVCHIKMAISDRTRPDMGWRRAPLATAYAALRQRQSGLAPGSGGVSDWFWAPPVVSFMVPLVLCVVVVATKTQAPGAAAEVEGVLGCRLDYRDLIFSPDGC